MLSREQRPGLDLLVWSRFEEDDCMTSSHDLMHHDGGEMVSVLRHLRVSLGDGG